MDIVKSAVYFLLVLSVLVIVHEWGHFFVAKLCKMKVDDFSLFFGKRLIRLGVRNGTEYNIRSIPLGGFVKIAGMEPDDISNGAPIFKKRSAVAFAESEKTLRGLREEALADIDFDNISPRIRDMVDGAIGADAQLTEYGKQELETMLVSTSINADEHTYLEAILGADMDRLDPNGYNAKPLWQRAAVIFAGPFMSLMFGYILFCVMGVTTGLPDLMDTKNNSIGSVMKGQPADKAGLLPGDKIVEINGQPIADWESLVKPIHSNPGRPINIVVIRNNERLAVVATPEPTDTVSDKGIKKKEGRLGITPGVVWKRDDPVTAVKHGTQFIYLQITGIFKSLFSSHIRENVGGPIAIAGQIHQDSKAGINYVLLTASALSVSLGIINLFPIPILDGGHLMLLAIEGLRRRKLSSREVYAAQMVGLSIIAVLFVFVMYNDIARLITGNRAP